MDQFPEVAERVCSMMKARPECDVIRKDKKAKARVTPAFYKPTGDTGQFTVNDVQEKERK